MAAYYSENDPFAAAWLRELIKAGLIADGEVDERSIELVRPDDLRGFAQCHFFAGIGGWSLALRLASWDDARPVWTGSCPCQPFSAAGKALSADDSRHLWPTWYQLVSQCRPSVVFGEQVDSSDGLAWLDVVSGDLEAIGYAFGPFGLPACSVGAFHRRQRLWFVGESDGVGRTRRSEDTGRETRRDAAGTSGRLGDSERLGCEVWNMHETRADEPWETRRANGAWDHVALIQCGDGKMRPIKPGLEPMVDGVSGRVERLRGFGNAIVPQVAQVFIEAYMSVTV